MHPEIVNVTGFLQANLQRMTRKSMASPRHTTRGQPMVTWARVVAHRIQPLIMKVQSGVQAHPRWSLVAALMLTGGLVLSLLPTNDAIEPGTTRVMSLSLPGQTEVSIDEPIQSAASVPESDSHSPTNTALHGLTTETLNGLDESEFAPERDWTLVEVQSGQTMERIFRDLGLGPGLLHRVVYLDENTRSLTRIRPGDQFAFLIDSEGDLKTLRSEFDEQHWLFIDNGDEGLTSRIEPRALDHRIVEASGVISSSLFNAAKAAGMSDNMTMRLANIFGWDVDFALDIRAGDSFSLIYEEIWRDGEFLRDGPILAARFVNRGDAFEAIRFDAGDGPDYFAPDGRPMRKAFLRAPLNFTRVTSNFNPRRFHPITRQVRPHNGTDYGAPTGTPVWAAGDGRVIRSAYNNANGNYIFIQHGNNIVTRYLHLSRRDVRQGDRVRQGQTIGRVGATGMATGPHLHYEFLVNGAHRNPRTIDLPPADPLPAEQMEDFLRAGRPLLARLEAADSAGLMLASRDQSGCEGNSSSC
jgi:murein DD-endopeptidase MepM/ murein hydrolase activator NlpD